MVGVPPSGSPEFCPLGPAQVPSAEGRTHTLSLSVMLVSGGPGSFQGAGHPGELQRACHTGIPQVLP